MREQVLLGKEATEDALAFLVAKELVAFNGTEYAITTTGRETSVRLRNRLQQLETEIASGAPNLNMPALRRLLNALVKATEV